LFGNFPGAPDNITFADKGKNIWVALVIPAFDGLGLPTFMRHALPYIREYNPKAQKICLAIKYNL